MARKSEAPETRRLRQFHELGKQVLEADKLSELLADGKLRRGVSQQFKETRGLERDQVEKARQFAATYSDQELNELCGLKSEDGSRLVTKSHVIRLLTVRSKRSRARLVKQVIQNGWSVQRLGQEITRAGKTSKGGRRPKRPATVEDALGQIERMVRPWVKWMEMMESSGGDRGVGIDDLPAAVIKAVRKMAESAGVVGQQIF